MTSSEHSTHTEIQLVALDLDGTLLNSQKVITGRCIKVIRDVMERGVQVVIASARPPRSTFKIYEHLQLKTPSIHYNGSVIYDFPQRTVLHHQPMCQNLAREMADVARTLAPDCLINVEILDRWLTDRFDEKWNTETGKSFDPDVIGPLEEHFGEPVTKLMLLGEPRDMQRINTDFQKRFAGRIAIAQSDDHLLQIMHHEVDKATALGWVLKRLGLEWNQVLAVGDAPNDIGMIQHAGLGIAMANAWEAVLGHADHVVADNDSHGVAEALEKYVLL